MNFVFCSHKLCNWAVSFMIAGLLLRIAMAHTTLCCWYWLMEWSLTCQPPNKPLSRYGILLVDLLHLALLSIWHVSHICIAILLLYHGIIITASNRPQCVVCQLKRVLTLAVMDMLYYTVLYLAVSHKATILKTCNVQLLNATDFIILLIIAV